MERAVHQAHQYGVQDDPEKVSQLIKEARDNAYQKARDTIDALRAEIDSEQEAPHVLQAMRDSLDGCVKAGLIDERDIRGSLLIARERAIRGG